MFVGNKMPYILMISNTIGFNEMLQIKNLDDAIQHQKFFVFYLLHKNWFEFFVIKVSGWNLKIPMNILMLCS